MSDSTPLAGRTAIVTGASSSIAEALGGAGAHVLELPHRQDDRRDLSSSRQLGKIRSRPRVQERVLVRSKRVRAAVLKDRRGGSLE